MVEGVDLDIITFHNYIVCKVIFQKYFGAAHYQESWHKLQKEIMYIELAMEHAYKWIGKFQNMYRQKPQKQGYIELNME